MAGSDPVGLRAWRERPPPRSVPGLLDSRLERCDDSTTRRRSGLGGTSQHGTVSARGHQSGRWLRASICPPVVSRGLRRSQKLQSRPGGGAPGARDGLPGARPGVTRRTRPGPPGGDTAGGAWPGSDPGYGGGSTWSKDPRARCWPSHSACPAGSLQADAIAAPGHRCGNSGSTAVCLTPESVSLSCWCSERTPRGPGSGVGRGPQAQGCPVAPWAALTASSFWPGCQGWGGENSCDPSETGCTEGRAGR